MVIDIVLKKLFGSKNERDLKEIRPLVAAINELEPQIRALSDAELAAKTPVFKERMAQGAALDDLLVEAFAVCREAGRRALDMRHFDVQLIGGVVLHRGRIAEMKTGEGKTLVATLAAYLNCLDAKGVHVVTVNDYLARRDSEWMGRLYKFLGCSVGVIQHDMDDRARQEAYRADITYGTNNELGFDFLRDNMKFRVEDLVQRGHGFGIVDEVDSILIDEARTPLIISGPAEESTEKYYTIDRLIPRLKKEEDFTVDEKNRTVALTDPGVEKAEKFLNLTNLYDPGNMDVIHHIYQALKAHMLFKRDVDYMVKDGQVVIVDEFTGRLMPGRRWSDGLHQAVEAKEKVKIERENQTLATITFQNYFRMYKKLSGMTGTADTEAAEFSKIYKLDVNVAPTNRPLSRTEYPDVVYRTEREKYDAVVNEIEELNKAGRPVLVGTVSIDKSEKLSLMLRMRGIKHVVLNAKYHEKEAEIVAQAGRHGAVTIATNMAGRGTDILLGGNAEYLARDLLRKKGIEPHEATPEQWRECIDKIRPQVEEEHNKVVSLGGLHVLGTERHESRRIDNQLRGRAGRQGDPGSSRFYLSLEDDLMRIFGSDRISGLMKRMGMEEGIPIEHKMVTRAIERAQKQVEAQNFGIRKHLLEYDDVMNKQREAIYTMRREILGGKDQRAYVMELSEDVLGWLIESHGGANEKPPHEWERDEIRKGLAAYFGLDAIDGVVQWDDGTHGQARDRIWEAISGHYSAKEQQISPEVMRMIERDIILQRLDAQWKDHLWALDHLKEGIGLRGYGQRDPLVEYKRESFDMFQAMKERMEDEILRFLFHVQPVQREEPKRRNIPLNLIMNAPRAASPMAAASEATPAQITAVKRDQPKVGRNDPCPCGSGKKYKKCHGS
ncbi:MAG: preprotein translocase subunit SecA [Acidobacteria bacterium]|nr:preprotein translocase subunit SecA [Acidobacteriota bacterium]